MKIGILTQPLTVNYGGLLQNYALQTVLRRMGHEAITIAPVKAPAHRVALSVAKLLFLHHVLRRKGLMPPPSKHNDEASRAVVEKNMRAFIAESLATTPPSLTARDIRKATTLGFDAYVVGSDQVWRPRFSPFLPAFFLNFVRRDKRVKKIAYAASFGVDEWELTPRQTRMAQTLIALFDGISVREQSAVTLCKEYLNADAVQVLDPTLLLSQQDYKDLIDTHETSPCEGDLFVYVLDRSGQKQAVIDKVSSALGLTPFELMPTDKPGSGNGVYPSVYQWLRSFRDAKFVVTDSFHGTVFSILFNKPFISISNALRGQTRFTSLLSIFGLQRALVHSAAEVSQELYQQADAAQIEAVLTRWREKSNTFLHSSLSKK